MNNAFRKLACLVPYLICFSNLVFANSSPSSEQWSAEDYAQNGLLQFKWAKKHFFDRFEWSGHEQVLDIGCGDGRLTHLISKCTPFGNVLGIDNSPSMINYAHQNYTEFTNLSFVLEDATNAHFYKSLESQFDVIVSFHCLHWVEKQESVLLGIKKSLKPEGKAFLRLTSKGWDPIQDSADELIKSDKWKLYFSTFRDPIQRYSKAEYLSLIENANLQALRIEEVVENDVFHNIETLSKQVASWLPHLKHLPSGFQKEFLNDIMHAYLLKVPPNADGSIHLYDCYLEVEFCLKNIPKMIQKLALGCVKAPGLNDRKRVHISNIDPFAIAQPRELILRPKFQVFGPAGYISSKYAFCDLDRLHD
jgi:trans-aconitate methyltransferase